MVFPVVAEADAEKVTDTGWLVPGVNENDEGDAVSPDGSPSIVTATEPTKPFSAVAETATAELVAPCATEIEDGETDKLKSGLGGGGGVCAGADELLPPPPQATAHSTMKKGR